MSRARTWSTQRTRVRVVTRAAVPRAQRAVTRGGRTAPAPEDTRRTVRGLVAVFTAGTLLLVGLLLWVIRGGATSVPDDPGRPAVVPASTYRAVYRADDTAGPQHLVQTDVVELQRPDRLLVEHRDGPPPGGTVRSGGVVDGGRRLTFPEGVVGFATPLTIALDTNVVSAPALRAAADAGRAERRGQSIVHEERCTTYVYRSSGTEALATPDGSDHVETCVTPDGIVARQAITVAGRQARVDELVSLDRSPHFGAGEFAIPGDVSPAESVTERMIEGRPATNAVRAVAPEGFHLERRLTDSRDEGDAPLLPYFIQSFSGGGEFVVVQQLLLRETSYPPWTASDATHLDLGDGRSAEEIEHTGFVEEQTVIDGFPVRVLASRAELAEWEAATVRPPA